MPNEGVAVRRGYLVRPRASRFAYWAWALSFVLVVCAEPAAQRQGGDSSALFHVQRVVDGDTVILERIGRVRLIGVDTPESVDPRRPVERFGREASEFLKRLDVSRIDNPSGGV
jgi:endonuclease YncB( thermonuclease family)